MSLVAHTGCVITACLSLPSSVRARRLYYQPDATLAECAAVLAWGLIKNHAFIDGNKRIGLLALITFLDENGHRLSCSQEEETEMVLRAAAGTIKEAEWIAWVVQVAQPLV